MIVDVHSHIPTHRDEVPTNEDRSDPLIGHGARLAGSLSEYVEAMSTVDRAIVFGMAPKPGELPPVVDWRAGWPDGLNQNDIAARAAAADPDRLIPFMSLHPEQDDLDDEYDRAVGDLGCKGIKLALSYQGVDPVGEAASHLFRRLEEDGLPVVFPSGGINCIGRAPRQLAPAGDGRRGYGFPQAEDRPWRIWRTRGSRTA